MTGFTAIDRFVARWPLALRASLAFLVLGGLLLAMVESRARILRSGTEVRLKTAPVDPRDLFRGDYVVLRYEISVVPLPAGMKEPKRGDRLFVRLGRDGEGFARVAGVSAERPAETSDPVILGRVTATRGCLRRDDDSLDCARRDIVTLDYGIESYFVPQGEGRRIERMERRRIEVVAAVSSAGEAAIKRLLIDGTLVYAEPPY